MDATVAVIPVAGQGTRMYPLSRSVKKEFLPLIDTDGRPWPLVHLLVKEALDSGVEQVCLVVHPDRKHPFEHYFHGGFAEDPGAAEFPEVAQEIESLGQYVAFAEQSHQWGLGHAIWSASSFVGTRPCLVLLGDHGFASTTPVRCARQVLDAARDIDGSLSAVNRAGEEDLPYFGTMRCHSVPGRPKVYETEEIIEKPEIELARARLRTPGNPDKPYLCWFGIHLLSPTVLDCLDFLVRHREGNNEVGLTEAQEMTRRREGYWVFEIDGIRFDLGIPDGYRHAVAHWPGAVAPR